MKIFKKSNFIAISIVLAVILVFSFTISTIQTVFANSNAKFTIVLDAGHGGIDSGVIGINTGKKESDINLEIVNLLQKKLTDSGFRVVLTRKTSGGLYGMPTKGFKLRDMKERRRIIEESNANIVVSIHQNYFLQDRSRRGGQVFFQANNQDSKKLADSMQTQFNHLGTRDFEALSGDYYILNCTSKVAVIAECGFLSNAEEESLLITEQYQTKIVDAIIFGILQYLS